MHQNEQTEETSVRITSFPCIIDIASKLRRLRKSKREHVGNAFLWLWIIKLGLGLPQGPTYNLNLEVFIKIS